MIRRPPRSTLFPTRRSSDLGREVHLCNVRLEELLRVEIYRRGLHSDAFARENLRPVTPNPVRPRDRKSTRLNSSHSQISYAVFCLKKKKTQHTASASRRVNM